MTEQELASRCARGDAAARKELYTAYGSRILALCQRYVENTFEAEDMMQDAFIKIFRVIEQFQWTKPGSLYSWMARVALNQTFDSIRNRRKLTREIIDVEDLIDETTDEPEYDETSTIPMEDLHNMIESLPEGYKTVFKLYCIDDLSHKEIAALLGINEKSSSASLARARALLAKTIRQYLAKKKV
jgi:RNA polymerase sigma-70 factor (ECF subfamily)